MNDTWICIVCSVENTAYDPNEKSIDAEYIYTMISAMAGILCECYIHLITIEH